MQVLYAASFTLLLIALNLSRQVFCMQLMHSIETFLQMYVLRLELAEYMSTCNAWAVTKAELQIVC